MENAKKILDGLAKRKQKQDAEDEAEQQREARKGANDIAEKEQGKLSDKVQAAKDGFKKATDESEAATKLMMGKE